MTDPEVIEVWPARRGLRIEVSPNRERIWIISPADVLTDQDAYLPVDAGNLRDLIVVLDDLARKLGV